MKRYEITFEALNSESYSKPITVLVVEPDSIGPRTGAMLFTHGWGGNRFQYEETMLFAAERFDLVCLSVEFRQSGYDFDPVKGEGAYLPYDASFYQTFDVLNGLRTILSHRPEIDRSRLFHYGGSQGGHIALLSAVFAPNTFAFLYATSPVTHMNTGPSLDPGRDFSQRELMIRDVIGLSDLIECPVYLEHGTADEIVPHKTHTEPLEQRLRARGNLAGIRYYEGASHSLAPVTNRLETFKRTAPKFLASLRNDCIDDFTAARRVKIPCDDWKLVIDWSKPADDFELVRWERNSEIGT